MRGTATKRRRQSRPGPISSAIAASASAMKPASEICLKTSTPLTVLQLLAEWDNLGKFARIACLMAEKFELGVDVETMVLDLVKVDPREFEIMVIKMSSTQEALYRIADMMGVALTLCGENLD